MMLTSELNNFNGRNTPIICHFDNFRIKVIIEKKKHECFIDIIK